MRYVDVFTLHRLLNTYKNTVIHEHHCPAKTKGVMLLHYKGGWTVDELGVWVYYPETFTLFVYEHDSRKGAFRITEHEFWSYKMAKESYDRHEKELFFPQKENPLPDRRGYPPEYEGLELEWGEEDSSPSP